MRWLDCVEVAAFAPVVMTHASTMVLPTASMSPGTRRGGRRGHPLTFGKKDRALQDMSCSPRHLMAGCVEEASGCLETSTGNMPYEWLHWRQPGLRCGGKS